MKKRILSFILAAVLTTQMVGTTVFAEQDAVGELSTVADNDCEFAFSAAQYVLSEAEGNYEITVKRNGSADFAADAAVKLIDIQSEYGTDYLVYDEDGNPLQKMSGTEILQSDEGMIDEFAEEHQDFSADNEDKDEDEAQNESSITTAASARAALFGMDTESTEKAAAAETENNVEKSLKTMYDGLNEAEGVLCKVSFEKGQTEKTFTIEILDNDLPQADRVVLMALMASTEGSISANGTAVLTIEDDEEYEKPIISVESDVTANPKTGTAEVVLKRETGVNYYTSVNAYTYSESAVAGEDFVSIDGEQICFVPGETEKTVSVQIKDFSENAQLGLRIEPDTTCGVAANADRAVIYIEADRLEDNEETVEINAYEQEEIRPFFSEAGFYGLQSMSEDILGTPYVEIGANEWVAGPYTQIQRDRGGNLWAVSKPDDPLNVLVNEQYRFIAYVVLTDEKGLLEMPGTTAKVSLSTTGMNNLKSNLKYEARETLNKASYSAFSTSDKKNYTASPYISHKYTPNISGNVSFLSRWGDQNYPGGLAIMKGYKVFPLMPMKLYYRVFTADYVTFDNFKDTRYDLSDGKYTEKPILGSEYTPPVMYLYDNDRNIVRNYYASASTDVFFNSYETEAKTSELYKRGIRPNKLKLFPFHTADLETVELKNTNKTSLPVSFAGMVKSEYTRIKANISFKDTDRAKFVYKDDISAYVGEEVKIRALVESASDRIVNFIAVPVYKNSDGSEYGKYEWSSDISCVNGEALFNVPPVRIENEDNFIRFDIIPQTEECRVIVKPIFYDGNKDGENDFILPEGAESYEGVVMVGSALNEQSEETVQKTDADGNMSFKVTPHAPVILKAVCPAGYTVTWWDLSGDLNGDGIIDNDEIAEGQLDDSGQRYFTVSGDVYCGSAWNGSTTIGYGFKKKTLDTSGIRKGTVRIDTRSFYDLVINNSTKIPAGNLKPVSGVNVTIGGVSAKTDANGNFEMDMSDSNIEADGNIAPMLTYSDGGSSRTVYVGNIAPERFRSDLRIPSYDVYMPKSLTVRYNGEDILRDNTILIKDKILIVQAQVEMPENGAADVLTGADFTIVDENGRVRENCDFTARQAEQAELIKKAIDEWKKKNSSRDWDKLDEADKGLYLVGRTVQNADGDDKVIDCYTGFDRITNKATLVLNPQKFASTNDRIFISYKDDQRNYRRMNLGYTFLKPPSMGRFIMGAIGSTSTSDSITLLGIPMLNFDMGEIEGFTQTTGKIKGAPTIKDGADYQQTYNAVRFGYGKVMNFDNNETFGGWWNYGTQFETDKPNTSASGTASSEGNNKSDNTKPVENEEEPKDKNQKNSSVGLGEGDSAGSTDPSRVNTLYNYTLTPEFGFEMVLSSRGKNKDGTDRYGFECLRANLSVTGHYDVLITIDLVKLIAIEIQPKIDVNITGVYMLRSTYDDEINLEPVIEFGGDNSGFRPFSKSAIYENTRSYGYLGINPTLTIEAGLKIAIIRVKISASFDFDFDFLFDSQAADKTYGMMTYKTTLRVMLFSFDVFTMDMHNPVKVHLFGENEPLEIPTIDNSGVLASYDDGEKANAASVEMAILSAIEETIENSVVTQSDRSYLSERSGWLDGGIRLFAANDNTEPKTLQEGTAEYGSMQSVRFGDDDIFAVYIDDVPERGDVNRYALYYTCSTDGGNTCEAPQIIDDDGTLDDYPSLCQLNDGNILITWSSADSILDSNAGINDALGSMNLKSAVFNTDNMKMGTVMQITNTTEGDTSSDTYSAPAPFLNSNGDMIYRVYYLKADYNILSTESSEVMNSLTTTESIIAYRDYNTATGEWSEEYTEEQQITLSENGIDPEEYEAQWYGQQFVDTRMGTDSFNYITEIAACSTGGISYLAYIVDWDKDMKTTEDRDVFAMCNDNVGDAGSDDPNYKLPVCITDKTGSYSEL
ncbi:MAG: Calx-beta domain-containing protein, partial [Clostridia bacterium]|nr:Calx-beta domain-containing protein [Clostridia bacterium]